MTDTTTASTTTPTPPRTSLRWGFIGCGKISNDFANALKSVPRAQLVACAARSLDSAQEFAATHGFAQAYGSYEDLVADPQVDIVYIGTIHTSHAAHSLLALEHDKHVLVEKPMAMNAAQARNVLAVAKAKQRFFLEGMWTRFFPAVAFVRDVLAANTIGAVHHVRADIGFAFDAANTRMWDVALGGGGLLDIGIYPLAFVTMAFGVASKPEAVSAVGKLSDSGVDVYGNATIAYSHNRFASVTYTCLAQMGETVTIVGTSGRIEIHSPAHVPTRVTVYVNGSDDAAATEQTSEFAMPPRAADATLPNVNFGGSEGFVYEAEAVTTAVLDDNVVECSAYSHAESLLLATIMDKIRADIGVVYAADEATK